MMNLLLPYDSKYPFHLIDQFCFALTNAKARSDMRKIIKYKAH
jgi:hypothetical protein